MPSVRKMGREKDIKKRKCGKNTIREHMWKATEVTLENKEKAEGKRELVHMANIER